MILEKQTWARNTEMIRLEKADHGAGYFLHVKGSKDAQSALLEKIIQVKETSCEWSRVPRISNDHRDVLTIRRVSGRSVRVQLLELVTEQLCDLGFSRLA